MLASDKTHATMMELKGLCDGLEQGERRAKQQLAEAMAQIIDFIDLLDARRVVEDGHVQVSIEDFAKLHRMTSDLKGLVKDQLYGNPNASEKTKEGQEASADDPDPARTDTMSAGVGTGDREGSGRVE